MTSRATNLALCTIIAAVAGCGGGPSTPATGATPSPTPRTARDAVRGEVVAVNGDEVTLTAADGTDSHFTIAPSTQVRQQQTAALSDVAVGTCASGFGKRATTDLVEVQLVIIEARGPHGGCRQASGGPVGGLGAAGGAVTAVDGDVYSVNSNAGPQRFRPAASTKVLRLVDVPRSTLVTGQCVTARGHRDSAGQVIATSVIISPAATSGCFPAGGGGAPGGG